MKVKNFKVVCDLMSSIETLKKLRDCDLLVLSASSDDQKTSDTCWDWQLCKKNPGDLSEVIRKIDDDMRKKLESSFDESIKILEDELTSLGVDLAEAV